MEKIFWEDTNYGSTLILKDGDERTILGSIHSRHYLGTEYTEKMRSEKNVLYYASFRIGNFTCSSEPLNAETLFAAKISFQNMYSKAVASQLEKVEKEYNYLKTINSEITKNGG